MIKYFRLILFGAFCTIIYADPPDWQVSAGDYEFTATIAASIVQSEGVSLAESDDMFAAFDGDGNVRGVAVQLSPPFGPYEGQIVYEMQLYSNTAGDLLSFKYYDASADAVLDIAENYVFVINDILGDAIEPVFYNTGFVTLSFANSTLSSVDINYVSNVEIGGFQFDVEGASLQSASGGAAEEAGFTISYSAITVLGFSASGATIPAGNGTLVSLNFSESSENRTITLNDIIISHSNGSSIPYSDPGDVTLCNADCNGDCGGSAVVDECGVCGGGGAIDGLCDGTPHLFQFNQSSLQGFYFFETVTINDIYIAANDWVGVFNQVFECTDPAATLEAWCEAINENWFLKEEVCVGSMQWDTSICNNGICSLVAMGNDGFEFSKGYMNSGDIPVFKIYDSSENQYYDAVANEVVPPFLNNGIYMLDNLSAMAAINGCMDEDACNYDPTATNNDNSCVNIAFGECDCDGNMADCAGECAGDSVIDECGICGGSGIAFGECDCDGNVEDECGICGGPGAIYECGCTGIVEGACDCSGNVEDECGVCGGSGIVFGACDCDGNVEDECGICSGPGAIYECGCTDIPEGACDCAGNVEDCAGECAGNSAVDECGVCGGECILPFFCDECGVCNGTGIPEGKCDCYGNEECTGCMDDGYQHWSPNPGSPACNYDSFAIIQEECLYNNCLGECPTILEDGNWITNPEYTNSQYDDCGVCSGDFYESYGDWCGGSEDETGNCCDCHGTPNGSAYLNAYCNLEECVGGDTDNPDCFIIEFEPNILLESDTEDNIIEVFANEVYNLKSLEIELRYNNTLLEVTDFNLNDPEIELYDLDYKEDYYNTLIQEDSMQTKITLYFDPTVNLSPFSKSGVDPFNIFNIKFKTMEILQTEITTIRIHSVFINEHQINTNYLEDGDIMVVVPEGCMDAAACNYDPNVHQDDGCGNESGTCCEYQEDCAGECGGSASIDICDACTDEPETDFGNCFCTNYAGLEKELDCNQDCPPDEGCFDEFTSGCAYIDNCGICVDGLTERIPCVPDCSISPDNCDGNWKDNKCWGGSAYNDACEQCITADEDDCFEASFKMYNSNYQEVLDSEIDQSETMYIALHMENLPHTLEGINLAIEFDSNVLELIEGPSINSYPGLEPGEGVLDNGSYELHSVTSEGLINALISLWTTNVVEQESNSNILFLKFNAMGTIGTSTVITYNYIQINEHLMKETDYLSQTVDIVACAIFDECDICNGGNVQGNCEECGLAFDNEDPDCAGVCGGTSDFDLCNDCVDGGQYGGNSDCVADCAGVWGGSAKLDQCGICDNYFVQPEYPYGTCDCVGIPEGDAFFDNCEICVGGSTGLIACEQDCEGIWGGPSVVDICGECGGDNSPSTGTCDCVGIPEGDAFFDNCDACVGGSTGLIACEQDCAGIWGGPDNIPNSGDEAIYDECGICDGPGATAECGCDDIQEGECDCEGNVFDACGICENYNSTDGVQPEYPYGGCDCNGDVNGTATFDQKCGNGTSCVGGNTGFIACEQDCADLWGGPDNIPNSGDEAIYDECGICDDYDFNDGVQPEYPYGSCDCIGEFANVQLNIQQNKRTEALEKLESLFDSKEIYIADMCRYQYAWLSFLHGEIDGAKTQLSAIVNDTIFKELAHIFQAEILDFFDKDISAAIDSYLEFLELYPQSIYYDNVRLRLRELAS